MTAKTSSRLAWTMAALALAFEAVGIVFAARNGLLFDVKGTTGPDLYFAITYVGVGLVIATRRRSNAVGWLFLGIGLVLGARAAAAQYGIYGVTHPPLPPGAAWAMWYQNWALSLVFPDGMLLFLFLLFPTGRLLSPRWKKVAIAAVAMSAFMTVLIMFDPSRISVEGGLPTTPNPVGVKGFPAVSGLAGLTSYILATVVLVAATIGLVLRYRRSRGEERAQVKWFAFAALLSIGGVILANLIPHATQAMFTIIVILGLGLAVPVSCAVAILKYGLYEIDVIINRTVLYTLVAAFFTLVYVGIVVGLGAAVGSKSSPALTVTAAVVIAVAFQPVRERARRFANRLVYGERATPYEVLSAFSERMAGTYSIEDVLPRMARILGEGTGARQAEVWLRVGDELRSAASWPPDSPNGGPVAVANGSEPTFDGVDRTVPVRHQGELLGALTLTKSPSEPVTPAEDKLLTDLASQAGLVLRNAALTADLRANLEELRASRQRLVAAQDEERRRLERNLHDGAQQQLVAIAVKQRLAEQLVARDPAKATDMLAQLQQETADAIDNLRDLARGIYPPLLADKGLVAALTAQTRKAALPVSVRADGVGRYPQEQEACVYFCALEALQNVAKYAAASSATVRLWEDDGDLAFSVSDDGSGFDPARTSYGTGMQGMADRLAALAGRLEVRSAPGKGTTVTGRVPAEPLVPAP